MDWPPQILLTGFVPTPSNVSVAGGQGIGGHSYPVSTNSGFWRAKATALIHGKNNTLAYRAWRMSLDGAATPFHMPCHSKFRPVDELGFEADFLNWADLGNGFQDHRGFYWKEAKRIWARERAVRGSQQLTLNHPGLEGIRPGQYFGIGDRFYIARQAWSISREHTETRFGDLFYGDEALTYDGQQLSYGSELAVTTGENVQVVQFWPRLRADVAIGDMIILGRPICRMRLASDETGILDQSYADYGTVEIDLIEATHD